jgi:hypothetical protein
MASNGEQESRETETKRGSLWTYPRTTRHQVPHTTTIWALRQPLKARVAQHGDGDGERAVGALGQEWAQGARTQGTVRERSLAAAVAALDVGRRQTCGSGGAQRDC